jgi:mono/diheme cytochrome c family protein
MKHKISLSCLLVGILAIGLAGTASADTKRKRQSISFGPVPTVTVGGTGTVNATASSGLPVTLTSTTQGVCTLSGNTVTGVKVGTCTIAANQAGNATYAPAPTTQLMFNVTQPSAGASATATCADGQTWPVSNDPVIDGRRAYLRLNCEGCHGQTGLGGMGPNIQGETEVPLNGDGAMPSFTKFLCPNDARDLIAYLKVIRNASAPRFLDWDKVTPSANSGPFSDAALP